MAGKKCVYRHVTLKDNIVFYIGIGTIKRPYSKSNRSKKWKDFTEKNEYFVDIMFENLEWSEACELEMFLIEIYGRLDKNLGTLLNMSDGGEGNQGYLPSEEFRKNHSIRMTGSGNPNFNKPMEEKQKILISKTRRERGIGVGDKNPMFGRPGAMKGKRSPMFGKKLDTRTKDLIKNKLSGGNCYCSKLVLCTETGIYYDCIKEASVAIGVSYNSMKSMLSGRYKNRTSMIKC